MRELFRDVMLIFAVAFGGIQAWFAWHGPAPSDPQVIQNGARHPVAGLIVFALLFLAAGVLNSMPLLLRFFAGLRSKELTSEITEIKSNDAVGFASSLLQTQAYEIARTRLDELGETGQFLVRRVPKGNASARLFTDFWNDEVGTWKQKIFDLLRQQWGDKIANSFVDTDGFNKDESVGDVHSDCADWYRDLLHGQRNLKNIRHLL